MIFTRDTDMTKISTRRSLLLYLSIFLQFLSGFSDDSNSQKETSDGTHASSRSKNGSKVLVICIVLAAVVGLSSFIFKQWQKKKREEQYARLLKLFEENDELELGLND